METGVKFALYLMPILFVYATSDDQNGGPPEGEIIGKNFEYKFMERLIILEQDYKRIKERLDKIERESKPTPVAVKVRLSGNKNLATNKRVMYDTVVSNVGNAYDPVTGQFEAPVAGIYMVVVQACLGNAAQSMYLDVLKNGAKVGRVFSADRVYHNCGTEAVSMQLNAGDKVWVDRDGGSATILNEDLGWNSFTAVLVQGQV